MSLSSANGILSLLDDRASEVRGFALLKLYEHADTFWPEISEKITQIETLYEDSSFKHNKLAALLASKVYYHLSEFKESLYYALCAEELYDVTAQNNEFVDTINSKCIDEYIKIRQKVYSKQSEEQKMHQEGGEVAVGTLGSSVGTEEFCNYERLEQVVTRMFERCMEHGQYKQALGVAVESRRLDMLERAVMAAHNIREYNNSKEEMLQYAFKVSLSLIGCKGFRNEILSKLVKLYNSLASPDYINMCQCLIFLDDHSAMADLLESLITAVQEDGDVICYQLAFDMYENASQQFMNKVKLAVQSLPNYRKSMGKLNNDGEKMEIDGVSLQDEEIAGLRSRYEKLESILSGEKVIDLHLQFLIKNNHSDLKLLDRLKVDVRHSVTHNATVIANGLMHFGTTSDQFLRDNLDWLGRAVNWAKFTATSTLGLIHRGHEKEALKLMAAYLPKEIGGGAATAAAASSGGSSSSMYTEGGGLYALGLMHANHGGSEMTDYLLRQSREASSEPVRHGACLGLGLAAMGTERQDVYEQLKSSLYMDDAVTGEAAALSMGLVMVASGSRDSTHDMLSYAKDTAHEKITRGLALGIALTMYGRQEEADSLIDTLTKEKQPILRWSAMATVAMAYCGTGDNSAVRRLLHSAVSDNSDDVRRWAVTALGFVLFKSPEQLPSLVSLLSESYNPHVRYGAVMALGVGCAGTALREAISVVEPLLEDPVAFVRQGALVAMAMVLIQQNKITCPKSIELREKIFKIVTDRHEDLMTKYGAIIAMGILEAGGRNVTISLKTRTGNTNMSAAVGLLVFQNYWFWYPFTNFISLAFTPTCVIILNKQLNMPKIEIKSKSKPSVFAYPEPTQIEKEKKKEKVETAILSVTARQQQRKKESEKIKQAKVEPMIVVESVSPVSKPAVVEVTVEPDFVMLQNPARVMSAQLRVIELAQMDGESRRYTTVKSIEHGGILMVRDSQPNKHAEIVESVKPSVNEKDEDDEEGLPEPEAPEPFFYDEGKGQAEAMETETAEHSPVKEEQKETDKEDDISKPE